jgi:hypothetical protein
VDEVEGVVDDSVDVISDTVDTASDTTDHGNAIANQLLPGTEEPSANGGEGSHHHASGARERRHDRGARERKTHAPDPGPFVLAARPAPRPGGATGAPAVVPIRPTDERASDRDGADDRLATVAVVVTKGIVTVLLLLGAALAFVLIQDRLDRNEPRLALSPVRSDDVRFE